MNVITRCYWPIFQLADLGFPIGVEAPGVTLEIINDLDPDWIAKLSEYICLGKIEFIGSGYSQAIGPLLPFEANDWNQKIGLEVYKKLIGVIPDVALINEMAYSAGMVEVYRKNGYKGIIMEWNNPHAAHPEWDVEWQYFPQIATGSEGNGLPVIWADSIVFQKHQRYVHGEYSLDTYVDYIKSHTAVSERYFPIYSNDVEIFDYRPGRYKTELDIENVSEWGKIYDLYEYLRNKDWCEFVFPSEVLECIDNPKAGNMLKLESSMQPIPVKKQEKYNIIRWALSGRNDFGINTKCYQIFRGLESTNNSEPEDWKELCYLWSSDFRTHITENRWSAYIVRLENFKSQLNEQNPSKSIKMGSSGLKPDSVDSRVEKTSRELKVTTDKVKVAFNCYRGNAITSCIFEEIYPQSLLGTLEHGYYNNIALGADYYSGHAVIAPPARHKISDLALVQPYITNQGESILVSSVLDIEGEVRFETIYTVASNCLSIEKKLYLTERKVGTIHPLHITLNPEAWDLDSLYFATKNGGRGFDHFQLGVDAIEHKSLHSTLISAVHGLGATSGEVIIGDRFKYLLFTHDMAKGALLPGITYMPVSNGQYFLRVTFSAQEIDETFRPMDEEQTIVLDLQIQAGKA